MHTEAVSSNTTVSSSAVTIYGIPAIYIVIAVLLILFVLYLICKIIRKDRHSMKKSSYIKLFIALYAPLFLYNIYNMYDGIRFAASVISLDLRPLTMIVILTIALSLVESIFPYLFLTLCVLIVNCFRKPS